MNTATPGDNTNELKRAHDDNDHTISKGASPNTAHSETEHSFKKPKLHEHVMNADIEGAHFENPKPKELEEEKDEENRELEEMLTEDGILHAENQTEALKDIVDEYESAPATVSKNLPGSVVEPIDHSTTTNVSKDNIDGDLSLSVIGSQVTNAEPELPVYKPEKPKSTVYVTRNHATGKYHLPEVTKEESLHARSYLKHYGAADFLDTYLPGDLHTLHIYHVIRLLGFQTREKDLLEAISKVIDNPDFFIPSIIPKEPASQAASSQQDSSDDDDEDEDVDREEGNEDDRDSDSDEESDDDKDKGTSLAGDSKSVEQENDESPFETTDSEPLEKKFAVKLIKDLQKAINRVLSSRIRLTNFYTLDHVVEKLKTAKKVLVLTGAGISTSLGIPDFRSSEGFYSKIKHLGLDDPQDVFNYDIFMEDPAVFYNIAHMILPPDGIYSPLHSFIKLLQDKGKLLRNYTQNIDNLESFAGISSEKLIQCHGSFATATCKSCNWQIPGEKIFKFIRNCELPLCPYCIDQRQKFFPTIPAESAPTSYAEDRIDSDQYEDGDFSENESSQIDGSKNDKNDQEYIDGTPSKDTESRRSNKTRSESSDVDTIEESARGNLPNPNLSHDVYYKSYGVMKPDITFFGEALPATFHKYIKKDALECDLLICIGTSLKVAPVSEIVNMVPSHVPQILINRDDVKHCEFDVSFLGLCDDVAGLISQKMNWDIPHEKWDSTLKSQHFKVENVDRGVYEVSRGSGEK